MVGSMVNRRAARGSVRVAMTLAMVFCAQCRTLREEPLDGASDGGTDASDARDSERGASCVESGICDPITSAGCEPGTRCWVFSGVEGDTTCVPEGRGRQGDPCASIVDCARGFSCNNERCYAACCGTSDDARCAPYGRDAGASRCAVTIVNSSMNPAFDAIRLCTMPCDPFAQDCPDGMNCYPQSATVRTCAQAGTVAVGAVCRSRTVGECVAGAICVNVTEDGGRVPRCLRVCDPRLPAPCPMGGECILVGSGVGACH